MTSARVRPACAIALAALLAVPSACRRDEPGLDVAAESTGNVSKVRVGGRSVEVRGASHAVASASGRTIVTGAGHRVELRGDTVTVDGDARTLPAGAQDVVVRLSATSVIVEAGGTELVFGDVGGRAASP